MRAGADEPLAAETPLAEPAENAYLVELYRPGFDVERLRVAAGVVRTTANELEREGRPVRFRRSTIVPADEAVLCLLEAASEEHVREVYDRAGIPFDRISIAVREER